MDDWENAFEKNSKSPVVGNMSDNCKGRECCTLNHKPLMTINAGEKDGSLAGGYWRLPGGCWTLKQRHVA